MTRRTMPLTIAAAVAASALLSAASSADAVPPPAGKTLAFCSAKLVTGLMWTGCTTPDPTSHLTWQSARDAATAADKTAQLCDKVALNEQEVPLELIMKIPVMGKMLVKLIGDLPAEAFPAGFLCTNTPED